MCCLEAWVCSRQPHPGLSLWWLLYQVPLCQAEAQVWASPPFPLLGPMACLGRAKRRGRRGERSSALLRTPCPASLAPGPRKGLHRVMVYCPPRSPPVLRLPVEAGQCFAPAAAWAAVLPTGLLSAPQACSRSGTVPRPTPGLVFRGPAQCVPRGQVTAGGQPSLTLVPCKWGPPHSKRRATGQGSGLSYLPRGTAGATWTCAFQEPRPRAA